MNILVYNWASIHSTQGGGVNVYLKNIIPDLAKENNVIFLSSGVEYTKDLELRIEKEEDYEGCCQVYKIVNSPVIAPAHSMFNNLNEVIENKDLREAFTVFIDHFKIDILYLNNLEGLSLDCLNIKSDKRKLKIVYTIHNYHCVCPQVNLWKKEQENCIDNNECRDCMNCVIPNPLDKELTKRICIGQNPIKRGIRSFYRKKIRNPIRTIISKEQITEDKFVIPKQLDMQRNPLMYSNYINNSINAINNNIDLIISVSNRTKEVACAKGIRSDKHEVLYIGTKIASNICSQIENKHDGYLTIAYIGYMRHDKGFWWLIYELENMPEIISNRLKLVIAAKTNKQSEIERLNKLSEKLRELKFYNGYDSSNLSEILTDVDLGIVPVIWEDCLPQVAYELVCNGIPILTSDLGGSKELGNNKNFIFTAKSDKDFQNKIFSILVNKKILKTFFGKSFKKPLTCQEHVERLNALFKNL